MWLLPYTSVSRGVVIWDAVYRSVHSFYHLSCHDWLIPSFLEKWSIFCTSCWGIGEGVDLRHYLLDSVFHVFSGCFANDAEAEYGTPLQYTRATETGVSIPYF